MHEEQRYEYYLLGDAVPVRVILDGKGLKRGAQTPDQETGQLVFRNTLLNRLETSPDVQEISEDDFLKFCDKVMRGN